MHQICALTDPFCSHALGARYPDGNGGFTIPYQSRQFVAITTDANGAAGYLFQMAQPSAQYVPWSSINAGTGAVTWGTAQTDAQYTTFGTNFVSYRVVSAGLRVMTTQAWTSATGLALIGYGSAPSSSGTYQVSNPTGLLWAEALPVRDLKCAVVGKFSDNYDSHNFDPLNSVNNYEFIMYPVFIGLSGCSASTNVMIVEVIVNYEFRALPGNAMQQMAHQSPPANPGLLQMASQALTAIKPVIVGEASKAIGDIAVGVARTAVGTYPAGRAALRLYDMSHIAEVD